MLELGSRPKQTTGILILLALIIIGYSGINLSLLYDTPLIGVSSESKLAKKKWESLKKYYSEKNENNWDNRAYLLIREENLPEEKPVAKIEISSQENKEIVRYKKETLPVITGIIISSDTPGKSKASVIINNKIYTENREVAGYMITGITKNSVTLTKNGKRYKIDTPTVSYSVDQGE